MSVGKIFKFHDDLDTDQIIASQYLLLPTIDEMKVHTFESLEPEFPKEVRPGDFVVGGENFGCGSSREQAPRVLKALGVQAVVAKSFARIFYRNAINIGLPILECAGAAEGIRPGDEVSVDFATGVISDETQGKTWQAAPFPAFIDGIIQSRGLLKSLKARGVAK